MDIRIKIDTTTDSFNAYIETQLLAQEVGFNKHDQTMLAIVASELSTNIIKYAQEGLIIISRVQDPDRFGIEIIALDKGAGIPDVEKALSEHYSTGKSLGMGLPAVKRIMDEFNIETGNEIGTKITTRKWKKQADI